MLTSKHKNASYIFSSFSFLGDFFKIILQQYILSIQAGHKLCIDSFLVENFIAPKEETLAVLQCELATAEVWDCYIMPTMELLNQYHYIS